MVDIKIEAKRGWATDREKAVPVKVKLEKARVSEWFADEATVTFVLGGERYHGWMPDYAVNMEEKWLKAFIVGDYENGDWLIFLPDETPKSTEFMRVPKADQYTTVVDGWW